MLQSREVTFASLSHLVLAADLHLDYTEIDDESLFIFARSARNLNFLSVIGCTVTDKGVSQITCSCKKLEYLRKGSSDDKMTSVLSLAAISRESNSLKYINAQNIIYHLNSI